MTTSRKSKRFSPTVWTEKLVPALLILLVLILAATLIVTVMALLGLTPSA